jgi:hypothetical protein
METLGIRASQDEIDLMVAEIDENGDGDIQFEEFVAVMSKKVNATYTPEEVKVWVVVCVSSVCVCVRVCVCVCVCVCLRIQHRYLCAFEDNRESLQNHFSVLLLFNFVCTIRPLSVPVTPFRFCSSRACCFYLWLPVLTFHTQSAFKVFEGNAPPGHIKMSTLQRALSTYGVDKLTAEQAAELLGGVCGDESTHTHTPNNHSHQIISPLHLLD